MSTANVTASPTPTSANHAPEFTLFETAIGRCGIAWGARGIVGVQLPEGDDPTMRRRLFRRFPGVRESTPPVEIQQAINGIVALLQGETPDLGTISLDMAQVPPFHQRVYEAARTIPPGSTLTYGDLGAQLGERRMAREVGQALGQNPFAIVVPCHRVVAANGKTGGFSARGGVRTKLKMLAIEGAPAAGTLPLFNEGG